MIDNATFIYDFVGYIELPCSKAAHYMKGDNMKKSKRKKKEVKVERKDVEENQSDEENKKIANILL